MLLALPLLLQMSRGCCPPDVTAGQSSVESSQQPNANPGSVEALEAPAAIGYGWAPILTFVNRVMVLPSADSADQSFWASHSYCLIA